MKFSELLYGVEVLSQQGDAEIHGVQYDSRKVKQGDAFLAFRGGSSDGNRFIDAALNAGATAIISDSVAEKPRNGAAWAQVADGRRALAGMSANLHGHPANKLSLTGITGTNGKSTTSYLVEAILTAANRNSLLIGTIEYHVARKVYPAPHTTPESLELNQLFARAVAAGATEGVMEVSSHALAQGRVFGLHYDVAIFTNLTRDHLDFHTDFEDYFRAKQWLFEGLGTAPPRVAVINRDDEYGRRLMELAKAWGSEVMSYGFESGDFHAEQVEFLPGGIRMKLVSPDGAVDVFSQLIGRVNVYNILAAATACFARGCTLTEIARGIAGLPAVPGRFEKVDAGQPFTVVVDYAHTDDALRNLTSIAREYISGRDGARVITLFGCGGDRDKTKRPLMGEAAGKGSDVVVLTSDNPRSENPMAILFDALPGLRRSGTNFTVEPDRRKAIETAAGLAKPGDIVLIAGKGHEKTQTTRDGVFPFDDVEEATTALRKLGYRKDRSPHPEKVTA